MLIDAEKVWKVARYTSAAPVFFKECDNYIDGGVIANNPCNFALAHIKQHLRKVKETQKKRCFCIHNMHVDFIGGTPLLYSELIV